MATSERSSHSVKTTLGGEGGGVAEDGLLGSAEVLGDGVTSDAGDGGVAVGIGDTVLDVEALDLDLLPLQDRPALPDSEIRRLISLDQTDLS